MTTVIKNAVSKVARKYRQIGIFLLAILCANTAQAEDVVTFIDNFSKIFVAVANFMDLYAGAMGVVAVLFGLSLLMSEKRKDSQKSGMFPWVLVVVGSMMLIYKVFIQSIVQQGFENRADENFIDTALVTPTVYMQVV